MYEDNTFLMDVLRFDLGSLQSQMLMYSIPEEITLNTCGYKPHGNAIRVICLEVLGCSKCCVPQLTMDI